MKRVLLALSVVIVTSCLLVSCQSKEQIKKEDRNKSISNINDNMEGVFAFDSITKVWHIEDHMTDGEDIDEDKLFQFTDEYITDEEGFESLNGYEQGLAMETSALITKSIKGEYDDDAELFEDDLKEYYDVLENGDEDFID